VEYCDLVMGNLWAAEKMLGIPVDTELVERGGREDFLEHALRTSEQIIERFPRVRGVAKTFRFDRGERGVHYYTTFYSAEKLPGAGLLAGGFYTSREYTSDAIVDKVGSGDCFMAGLIRGLCRHQPVDEMLEFATAAAFFKLFLPSDATDQPSEDIEKFMMTHE
jgi:2-dehydro-3-deoxygluconokinase